MLSSTLKKKGYLSLDPAIDMIFTMMASMAEQESDSMSQNISWSFQKNKLKKGKVSIHKCVGYTLLKIKVYINPDEAPIIKKDISEMKLEIEIKYRNILEYVISWIKNNLRQ